jgi:hypothetical protein
MKPKTDFTDTDCTSTGSLRLAQGSAAQANRRQLDGALGWPAMES